ncbi:MAG TPA: hypothetical protein VMD92_07535 [Acidobacteriaceae bacterium]|jgi:hypothetical protein|nr:hypothetical protein [Acidobacteriaceae bacterium]
MNQAGHIFAKDARHLRWEIAISLALTAAYVLVAPAQWKPEAGAGGAWVMIGELRLLAALLGLLVGVSWWLLITRVAQDESLVGDRQWWITKPYQWGELLSAKILFLAAFIFLPIVIAKGAVLAEGGFAPFAYLPGLGYSLVLFAAFLILPLLAIAMVTSTFARATLTTLGVLLALMVVAIVAGISNGGGGFTLWWIGRLPIAILLVAGGAAMGLQYARRRTWAVRLMLAGALVLVGVILSFAGNSALVAMTYPRGSAPLQLTNESGSKVTGYAQFGGHGLVGIAVPVQVSGIAAGTAVNLDAVQVQAVAGDGRQWTSRWESMWGARYRPDSDPELMAPLSLQIDRPFYEAEQAHPVTLHLRFAVTELRAGNPVQIAMPATEFSVPGFGICLPLDPEAPGDFTDLHCRAALRQPMATFVQVQWSDEKCGMSGTGAGTTTPGHGWAGALTSEPASFGINSIEEASFDLSNHAHAMPGRDVVEPRHLCPGLPITFTPYSVEGRSEYDVTFANYQMPELRPGAHLDQ